MTIIELLNEIAQDKEPPKRIKFKGIIFELNTNYSYENYDEDGFVTFLDNYIDITSPKELNTKIQILEE